MKKKLASGEIRVIENQNR